MMTRGRKLTTGRYATREELEDQVWELWKGTDANITDIARICRVSQPTVSGILDKPRRKHDEV